MIARLTLALRSISFILMVASPGFAQDIDIPGLGVVGGVEKIQGGFQFLEGPTKAPDGTLYFTDIPANKIYKLAASGEIESFFEPSGHANGLMYGGENKLLACQMDGQLVSINLKDSQVEVLAAEFEGKRFNACNDLVIDQQGGIYFTDPRYRAPQPLPQGTEAFYYRHPDGTVVRLGSELPAPNGIALSPDEKTLYVIPSMQSTMMAYPIESPGTIGAGKILCDLKQVDTAKDGGGDGLAVDSQGNLYITSAAGVQVVSPSGKILGVIAVPEKPANCAFGGEGNRTLFITAQTSLYRCSVPVPGNLERE